MKYLMMLLLVLLPQLRLSAETQMMLGVAPGPLAGNTGNQTMIIDGATENIQMFFTLPPHTYDKVAVRLGTVTAADEVSFTIQTVGTDGFATGSMAGGMVEGVLTTPVSQTAPEITFGTPCTLTTATAVALKIEFDSFASGSVSFSAVGSTSYMTFPSVWLDSGSGLTIQNALPTLSLHYTDGAGGWFVPINCVPASTATVLTIQSDTNPDEIGAQLTAPYAMRIIGLTTRVTATSSATGAVKFDVFNSSGSTLLSAPTSVEHDLFSNGGIRYTTIGLEPESVTASQVVTVGIFNAAADQDFRVGYLEVLDVNHWGNFAPDIAYVTRQRNDDNTPTNSFTVTSTRKPIMAIWVDSIQAGGTSRTPTPDLNGHLQ